MAEVKKVYQYVGIKAVDMAAGQFELHNKYDFLPLSKFNIHWTLIANAKPVASGLIEAPEIAPHEKKIINLDLNKYFSDRNKEYYLNFEVKAREPLPLIPAGFVVATEQIPIKSLTPRYSISRVATSFLGTEVQIKDTESELILEAKEVAAIFDKKTGLLKSYRFKGYEFLKEEVVPYFWRAPTDNDFGNRMPQRCAVWLKASHNQQLQKFEYKTQGSGQVRVETTLLLPDVPAKYKIIAIFNGQGGLLLQNSFTPLSEKELPEIPRMGMKFILPSAFSNLEWYGRGPHENYVDRKTSAFIGRYKDNVRLMKNPYVAAQEYGNRCENHWLTVRNEAGVGLMVIGLPDFEFSALPNTPDDLTQKWRGELHAYQVEPRDFTCLLISDMVTGVGGDDSWGARPHPQY
ncbi:MAG: DUF4981 domain-containing protein, partial [Candidatus Aminicenantes bacterium]|nr:DUF4981 domain-containing protein [Candidatus Aminicenantes bacterium]